MKSEALNVITLAKLPNRICTAILRKY